MNRKKAFLIFFFTIIILLCFFFLKPVVSQQKTLPLATLIPQETAKKKTVYIGDKTLQAEFAVDTYAWKLGLSNRPSLPASDGMLFLFPTPEIKSFWMKDTLIPLDIIWVNENKVIGFAQMFPELDTPIDRLRHFNSPSAVNVAIETNLNWTKENQIKIGDSVKY